MKPRSKEFKYKMSSFFLKGFIILVLVCLIRLTEFIIGPSLNNSLSWTFAGLWQDLIAAATWMVFIAPLYFVIARFFKRFADIVLAIWMTLGISLQILVIIYFSISSTALRAEHMYGMSGSQVDFLTNLYGFSWYYLLAILPLFLGVDLLLKLSEKLEKIKLIEFIASCIIIFGSLANIFWPLQESDYSSDFEFEVKANKSQVFIKSYFEYEPGEINISEKATKDALLSYYELSGIEKEEYFDYPFFSPEKSKNHLGEYFVKRDVAPNVVVIISESLCKIFSGPNARLGSFTPFLDSLIDHSLYFENCLANAERTFGAIPNLMAGVPEGDQGFMNLRSTMPDHLSLPMLLKEQEGYQTNFFCGAKKGYDYMDEYLMFQKFDNLYFEEDFEQNEIMGQLEFKNGEKRDFNWGAEDLKVFNESMQFFKRTDKNNPFFNLYLTTSFHEPYAYSDQPKFIKLAQKTIDKSKQENKDQLTSEVEAIAALMYMDASIGRCINNYRKRDDFENTIFVVVGDHGAKFLSDNSRVEKFHVPMIIYSPLLAKTAHLDQVINQKDLPSALQSLLRENFELKLPEFSISQTNDIINEGEGSFPLMYADKRLENYYLNGNLIIGEQVYQLTKKMGLSQNEASEQTKKEMEEILAAYRTLNVYSCYENMYLPYEEFRDWTDIKVHFQINDNLDEPYAGKHTSAAYQNASTREDFYSDSNSVSNSGADYLKFIDNELISSKKRIRLKMSFKIKSEDDTYPVFYISQTKEGEGEILNPIHVSNDFGIVQESDKEGWQDFQFSLWFDKGGKNNVGRALSIYLHKPNRVNYFIDDIFIELREF